MNRCKVTLVTFVGLFSRVSLQVCCQVTCPNKSKVTLVALICFFFRQSEFSCICLFNPLHGQTLYWCFVWWLKLLLSMNCVFRLRWRHLHFHCMNVVFVWGKDPRIFDFFEIPYCGNMMTSFTTNTKCFGIYFDILPFDA